MDKLKPLITHKYWIVFVAALILPTVGWWMATGAVSAETEAAVKAADGAFNSVPPSDSPNNSYAQAVQGVNQQLDQKNKNYNRYLWVTQKQVQQWPAVINDEMQALPHWADIPVKTRRIFRNEYFRQLYDVPKIVDAMSVENPIGKVQFDLSTFEPQVSPADWGTSPPDSETMWEVQEDLWLVQSLLSAIAATNDGYDNILQTPIKQIDVISLHGGSKQAAGGAPDPAAGAVPNADNPAVLGPGGGAGGAAQFGGGGLFGGKRGGNAGANNRGGGGASFDPVDVFGPDTATGGAAGGGPAGPGGPAAPGGAFDVLGGGQNNAKRIRYIDKEEGAPFKTRGFYMELVIDHTRLPDLMVHLASLDWPVEILRVQQQIRNPDDVEVVGGAGGRPGGVRAGAGLGRNRPVAARGFGRGLGRGRGNRPGVGGPAAPGAPMGRAGRGNRNEEEEQKAAEGERMYAAAMMKSTLVDVAIAGKMTIFQPAPELDEPQADQPAPANGETNPGQPAETQSPPVAAGETKQDADTTATPAETPNETLPEANPTEAKPEEQPEPKSENTPAETTPPATQTPQTEVKPGEP